MSARRAQRRADLVEATLDLVGEGGSTAVTVRSVCRKAGLTDRYFYESFGSRDELLVQLYNEVSAEIFDRMSRVVDQVSGTPREKARAAALTMVTLSHDDPRKSRLLLREPFSESALIAAGLAVAPALTRMVAHGFPRKGTGAQRALDAISIGGAIATLFATWQMGMLKVTDEQLIEHVATLIAP